MTIRWGIVGASRVAREFVIDAIRQQPDGEVVAVMSSDADRAKAYAAANDISAWYTDLNAMLAGGIDAVYVSTTNELHCLQTIAAARAGKHVLCEKPLAMTLAEAHAMVDACRAAGVVMGTNHHLRNAGSQRAMREAIKEGRIGRPLAARVAVAFHVPEEFADTWRMVRPEAGAGIVLDTTTHCIDSLRFILDDDPVDVTSMVQSGGLARGGIEDGAMSIFRFRSGLMAQTHEAFTGMAAPVEFEVLGTEGTLIGRNVMYQRPIGTVTLSTASGETELPVDGENLYVRGLRHFHAAIRGQGEPVATGADGVWSLAGALAVLESAKTGRAVRIEPGV